MDQRSTVYVKPYMSIRMNKVKLYGTFFRD